jgi:hypothetical protein
VTRFLKEMAKKELLVPHLDGWFNRGEFPDTIDFAIRLNKEPDDAFHPSSDSSLCAQQLFAKRMGHTYGRPFTGSSFKAFMVGHYWHEVIQYILVELGFSEQSDVEKQHIVENTGTGFIHCGGVSNVESVPVTGRGNVWWARGYIDIAHCRIPGRGDYLIDIKTMRAMEFAKNRPSLWDKYYAQLQMYLDWEGMQTAIVLCVEKDSPHRFKEILVERNRSFAEKVYERWDRVIQAVKDDIPPECDICNLTESDSCPADKLYEGVHE